ncbi:hypothetical protein BsWGS_01839 [Bradybaena similaris]
MDGDMLTVTSADLSLPNSGVDESVDGVGLHVLTTDLVHGSEGMMEELSSDVCGRRVIAIPTLAADVPNSGVEKDGEITLYSAFIPENAVLMETPRGLMLTVPEGMGGMSYADDGSPSDSSQQLLPCISVSLFSACDSAVDVDTSAVYGEGVSNDTESGDVKQDLQDNTEVMSPHLQDDSVDVKLQSKNDVSPDLLNQSLSEETTEVCVTTKRKGGWPKGKKRKNKPAVMGPRAPVTGYVLYAMDRRKEIKESHPEITFPEVTKILGQEWSNMAAQVKEKYLAAADADKKRYREELKAFRSSESYQETVRNRIMITDGGDMASTNENTDILNCDEENSNELHCKVCNVYFSSLHNKREHMYGKAHIQNVTEAVEKELLRQQQEEQAFMDSALVVSEDMSQDDFTSVPKAAGNSSSSSSCSNASDTAPLPAGPVDIHGFMMEFIHKNYEREQEISVLKKCLNKALQDNVAMCKEIQTLQEYQNKLEEELKSLATTTSSLIVQSDALKMVPTLFGIINL